MTSALLVIAFIRRKEDHTRNIGVIHIKDVKELAKRFTPEQIEGCITEELQTGRNVCLTGSDAETVINELSKAEFIRSLIEQGMSLPDALRELARRMRRLRAGLEE